MHISKKHLTYFHTVGLVYLKKIKIMKFYSSEILPKTLEEETLIQIFFALLYSVSKIILRTFKAEGSLELNRAFMIECFLRKYR